ncbi:MAG: fumarylacetoacetate hydrolase family protein [Planctomycetes bacterium]|nr:fumarylacetoacetate hydrolase family protein [Planctomycetota bacterium]
MRIGNVQLVSGEKVVCWLDGEQARILPSVKLAELLHADAPADAIRKAGAGATTIPLDAVKWLAPVERQEIWAAGVTYKRSQEARERESAGAARFYDLVYSAPRPELFFKSPAWRASGPGEPVHIRRDSKWNVPEPELALVISPRLKLVGFTIGNDMSSRDIEGENPLYLPQAKFYDRACAVGPCITLVDAMPKPDETTIRLLIERAGKPAFDGSTRVSSMKRTFEELLDWLGKETSFPDGVILLTGTGVVPPDDFTLAAGDVVHIDIAGIGRLTNVVATR